MFWQVGEDPAPNYSLGNTTIQVGTLCARIGIVDLTDRDYSAQNFIVAIMLLSCVDTGDPAVMPTMNIIYGAHYMPLEDTLVSACEMRDRFTRKLMRDYDAVIAAWQNSQEPADWPGAE